ncbi:hypothetical protein ACPCVO_35170 [Streptomyces umbrinus]|uniref:hypothetical protein n=1 Tax=Streptomyces umbrinus TaxID=67370 RepID=UPI003C2B7651
MTEPQPSVQIRILTPKDEDYADLTDVGLVNVGGERHLFLKLQSFDSAVRQVRSALPDLSLEQVERLLRGHSEFKDFEELLGTVDPPAPVVIAPMPDEPPQPVRPRSRAKRWVVAAALAPALVGSWALGYVTAGSPIGTSASAPDPSPTNAGGAKPFVEPEFRGFSKAGQIDCMPIADLEAECTDADGMVMSSKAATGPDSTIFVFSYGSERIGLRIFGDADYAETWARQDGTIELYPNLSRSGRYVLWGTDEQRLLEYTDVLRAEATRRSSNASMRGASTPLPPRLAALTLGTLGLNEQDVEALLHSRHGMQVDEPVLLAAQAVLGVGTSDAPSTGGDDIVAIAVGLDRPPVVPPFEPTMDMDLPVPTAPEQSTPPVILPPEPSTPPASDPVEETPAALETPA